MASTRLFDEVLNTVKTNYNIEFDKVYYKENEYYIYDHEKGKIYFMIYA